MHLSTETTFDLSNLWFLFVGLSARIVCTSFQTHIFFQNMPFSLIAVLLNTAFHWTQNCPLIHEYAVEVISGRIFCWGGKLGGSRWLLLGQTSSWRQHLRTGAAANPERQENRILSGYLLITYIHTQILLKHNSIRIYTFNTHPHTHLIET